MLPPVLEPFAGSWPKAGGQAAQQLQDRRLQGYPAVQTLHDEQPQHDPGGVDAVVLANAGSTLQLLGERSGQQPLKQGKQIGHWPEPGRGGMVGADILRYYYGRMKNSIDNHHDWTPEIYRAALC